MESINLKLQASKSPSRGYSNLRKRIINRRVETPIVNIQKKEKSVTFDSNL